MEIIILGGFGLVVAFAYLIICYNEELNRKKEVANYYWNNGENPITGKSWLKYNGHGFNYPAAGSFTCLTDIEGNKLYVSYCIFKLIQGKFENMESEMHRIEAIVERKLNKKEN